MDRWPLNVKADAFVVITLREANGNVVQECKSDQVGERERERERERARERERGRERGGRQGGRERERESSHTTGTSQLGEMIFVCVDESSMGSDASDQQVQRATIHVLSSPSLAHTPPQFPPQFPPGRVGYGGGVRGGYGGGVGWGLRVG